MEYIIGLFAGAIVMIIIYNLTDRSFFNSNVKPVSDKDFCPKFEITDINSALDGESNKIARYTAINCFFAKKNNKAFEYKKFYFYDKIGVYNVGDKLTLGLKNDKEC